MGKLCSLGNHGHNRHVTPQGSVMKSVNLYISKGHSRANFVVKKYSDLKTNSQSSKNHCEKKIDSDTFYIIGKKRLADKKFADCSTN